jgi:membrane protein YqaA with SNARE-associated domain
MHLFLDWLIPMLALPTVGLPALFAISFLSATLLPLGSEPALFAYVALAPHMYWGAIAVATLGNTLGGALDWWMGYAARRAALRIKRSRRHARQRHGAAAAGLRPAGRHTAAQPAPSVPSVPSPQAPPPPPPRQVGVPAQTASLAPPLPLAQPLVARHAHRLRRYGPAVLLFAWLPVVGDPLCALAGWLHWPLARCVFYMALGKLVRYIATTGLLLWIPASFWSGLWAPLRGLLGV